MGGKSESTYITRLTVHAVRARGSAAVVGAICMRRGRGCQLGFLFWLCGLGDVGMVKTRGGEGG